MHQPQVAILIINNNRGQDTLACLVSLAQNTYGQVQVMILDNRTSDGSLPAIRSLFPTVQIIELTENLGYAGNNNLGIRAALAGKTEWVFLLNDDTIVDPACLAQLVQIGESDPRIGMLGPMVYHHDEPTIIQSAGGLLGPDWNSIHLAKNEADHGQFPTPHQVEWISGCAILVRRQVIEQIGLLDERFFCYWEETEWCLRAGKAGWQIVHVPQAKLWHKGVQRDYRPKPMVTYYSTRNRLLMLAKHRAPVRAWLQTGLDILRTQVSWTVKPQWRSMRAHRDAMFNGVVDFLQRRWGEMPS